MVSMLLNQFLEAADLFAKQAQALQDAVSTSGRGAATTPASSNEEVVTEEEDPKVETAKSVMSEISGMVRYLSHREQIEKGFEVLMDDYQTFATKTGVTLDAPPAAAKEEELKPSASGSVTQGEEDSLYHLLKAVDAKTTEVVNKEEAELAAVAEEEATEEERQDEDIVAVDRDVISTVSSKKQASVRSRKSNASHKSQGSVARSIVSRLSRKSQSSKKSNAARSVAMEAIEEPAKEEEEALVAPVGAEEAPAVEDKAATVEEEVEDEDEAAPGKKPDTIEIPQAESVASKTPTAKSSSTTPSAILPVVSMLSMGSSSMSVGSTKSNKSAMSKKSQGLVSVKSTIQEEAAPTTTTPSVVAGGSVAATATSHKSNADASKVSSSSRPPLSVRSHKSKTPSIVASIRSATPSRASAASQRMLAALDESPPVATTTATTDLHMVASGLSKKSSKSVTMTGSVKSTAASIKSTTSGKVSVAEDGVATTSRSVASAKSQRSTAAESIKTMLMAASTAAASVHSHHSTAAAAASVKSAGSTKEAEDADNEIIIPPVLSMRSNASKASRKSTVSFASPRSNDSVAPVEDSEQPTTVSRMGTGVSQASRGANASIAAASVHSKASSKKSIAEASVQSKASSKKSMAAASVHSKASSKKSVAAASVHSKASSKKSVAAASVHSKASSKTSIAAASVHSKASSKKSSTHEEIDAASPEADANASVSIPPQLSMRSGASRKSASSRKSIIAPQLSLTKAEEARDEAPLLEEEAQAEAVSELASDAKSVRSTVTQKSAVSHASMLLKMTGSALSKRSVALSECEKSVHSALSRLSQLLLEQQPTSPAAEVTSE